MLLGPADVFVPGTVGGQVSDDRRCRRINRISFNLGFAFGSGESAAAQQSGRRYGVYARSAMSHRGAAEPGREGEEGRNVGCHDNPFMSILLLPASRLRMPHTPSQHDVLPLISSVGPGGQSVVSACVCVKHFTHCGMRDGEYAPLH